MRKTYFFICFLVLSFGPVFCQATPVFNDISVQERDDLRDKFKKAVHSRIETQELLKSIEQKFQKDPETYPPIVLSYYGALQGLKAKFSFNPTQKWTYLMQCLNWIDRAVEKDGLDAEIRFVRFSTLHHLPAVGRIPQRRGEDIEVICELLRIEDPHITHETRLEMVDFMLKSQRLNPEQKTELRSLYEKLQK